MKSIEVAAVKIKDSHALFQLLMSYILSHNNVRSPSDGVTKYISKARTIMHFCILMSILPFFLS